MEGKYRIRRGKHRVHTRRRRHMHVARLDYIRDSTTTWERTRVSILNCGRSSSSLGPCTFIRSRDFRGRCILPCRQLLNVSSPSDGKARGYSRISVQVPTAALRPRRTRRKHRKSKVATAQFSRERYHSPGARRSLHGCSPHTTFAVVREREGSPATDDCDAPSRGVGMSARDGRLILLSARLTLRPARRSCPLTRVRLCGF